MRAQLTILSLLFFSAVNVQVAAQVSRPAPALFCAASGRDVPVAEYKELVKKGMGLSDDSARFMLGGFDSDCQTLLGGSTRKFNSKYGVQFDGGQTTMQGELVIVDGTCKVKVQVSGCP